VKPVEGNLRVEARLRPLLAVLQLASPALPVGGFAYSQSLEKAIEDGLVRDAGTAQRWIGDLLLSLARFDAPVWLRGFDAMNAGDAPAFAHWNEELLAARETAELRAESRQMGASLARVLPMLKLAPPACEPLSYTLAFAAACAGLGVDREEGLTAYLWSWLENQVLVAVKSVPLGQQAGQQMLFALHEAVARSVVAATLMKDDDIGSAAIRFALTSARHESQYSRLYRS
jgi:urease accessory protein